ncbi:MAG: hypothetical protein ABFQ62_01995 [Patescibacteria group bacterium]
MKFYATLAQAKVLSSVLCDLAAGWFMAIFVTKNIGILIANIFFVIFALTLAIKIEEEIELC